jgi:hypothetical protein
MIRTYTKLREMKTLEERYTYLALRGEVGERTFGFDRYLNQKFYASSQWKQIRNHVINRDNACDLGIKGYEIHERIYIHHMNPMSIESFTHYDPSIVDIEYLISVTHTTHNAIHYGNVNQLPQPPVVRRPGDTKLW